ncbi:MAG: hypothetical protein NTU93_00085 [Arthrobacter sp.]|nr:hypothetical protein [Arthrobacter sp.]
MTDPQPRLLAWRVEIYDIVCIVFAATRDKAKWIAVRGYWDAFGRRQWPRPTARRAEVYDNSPRRLDPPQAWNEDYLEAYR